MDLLLSSWRWPNLNRVCTGSTDVLVSAPISPLLDPSDGFRAALGSDLRSGRSTVAGAIPAPMHSQNKARHSGHAGQ
eukprot:14461809-Alexandrium_andersonii.AAC.1